MPSLQRRIIAGGAALVAACAVRGEAEHDDAEATWSGHGYAGTWAIKSSETCEGTTLLQVAATKQ
ncbi:hypothetical protein [Nocardioides aquiterrae]|uniref:Lipoprotein n=1 Tax=Nocardioides aquiterrae TaxID=203799 RepID=A0ABN1UEE9_9ACTN